MNLITKKILAFAFLSLALFFTSCSDDDSNVNPDINSITIDFESVTLPANGVLGGKDANGSHDIGIAKFLVTYNEQYDFSSGVIISNNTDTQTSGYLNSFSAYAGSGAGGSAVFAVVNPFMVNEGPIIEFTSSVELQSVEITNTTYAALSMMNGDQFAKKFTAADEDFFKVIFKGFNGDTETGSVEAYLADFRTGSNTGILSTWKKVELKSLGKIDGIQVILESSDVGDYGMNTPAFVAIDNLKFNQ